ncbi:hypothetical protein Aduo_001770 [Ancylostoma duodenale]
MDFLLRVGKGVENDDSDTITLPAKIMCTGSIVSTVYGETIDASDTATICTRAILAPRNRNVDQLKAEALSRMSSEEKVYKSIDEALAEDASDAIQYQPGFLHKFDIPGMPPHELRLRKGA